MAFSLGGVSLLVVLCLPFVGSLIAAFLPTRAHSTGAILAGSVTLSVAVLSFGFFPKISSQGVVYYTLTWIPELDLNFSLRLDGFAWMFVTMITGIGFLVVIYARYYMSPEDPVPRFFSFLLGFMGSMLGIVMSGNLIQLALFWELTSLFSFLLISYWYHNANAREGARMALTITGLGGLALFAGLIIIGHIVGSYDLDKVLASGDLIRSHPYYLTALILVLLGALTKSAQFPFHFWLPQAMAAPTPVSAYLHSATMVKAGIFLLARFWPVMAGTDAWFYIIGTVGLATLLLGAYVAIFQNDLKGLLAYSTISHLGLITLLLSFGSPLALVAAIFHIFNHATFKASLFMAAGIIDHETGTRDIRRLSGIIRYMPITATLAMVASAAMAGVPLLNGFLSKEMFFAEAILIHRDSLFDRITPYIAVIASACSVAYSLRFIHGTFFGKPGTDLPRKPHEPPHWMLFPVEILVLICLVVGIAPALTVRPFLDVAVHAILGVNTPAFSLAVWHGWNFPFLMSIIALVGGCLLYVALRRYLDRQDDTDSAPLIGRVKGRYIFDNLMVTLSWRWARSLDNFFSTRSLQPQLRLMISVTILATLFTIGGRKLGLIFPPFDIHPVPMLVWLVGGGCAVGAAYYAKIHRMAALILMGGSGIATCITFAWFSAPDLAFTQLLVEIVMTVLFLLGLRWLPKKALEIHSEESVLKTRVRNGSDIILAVIAGFGLATICYAVMTRSSPQSISSFFLERSYTEAGGRNVVNVLLVDFRGFDTMGEITVLGIVALTVYALLRRFRPAPESLDIPQQQRIQNAFDDAQPGRKKGDTVIEYLMIPSVIMQLMFPVIIVLAAFLFLRGHDQPGGGFAAGLTMAIAFILQYMAGGTRWVETRLRILPTRWMSLGLMLAALTGAAAWLFQRPFLSTYFSYLEIPLIGKVPAASALIFDLGVFLLVVGATVLIIIALAHQSLRASRVEKDT